MRDNEKKFGIIGAMELEIETLKKRMDIQGVTSIASMEFHEGTLNGAAVVIVRSGVGKVNAAMCVQILADVFHVTHILNTGVAGSLSAAIDIGDIVISSDCVYHDVDATVWGYQPGEVPQIGRREFPADPWLMELAQASCARINPDIRTFTGRIVSGDQFIGSRETKNRIAGVFRGLCTEMEGTAIAQASFLNGIPFVILRAISDKADDSVEEDYPVFEQKAAVHCAGLVEEMLQRAGHNPPPSNMTASSPVTGDPPKR